MAEDITVVVPISEYKDQIAKATAYDILQMLVGESKETLLSIEEINKIIAGVIYT